MRFLFKVAPTTDSDSSQHVKEARKYDYFIRTAFNRRDASASKGLYI